MKEIRRSAHGETTGGSTVSTSDQVEASTDLVWHLVKNWSTMQSEETQHGIGTVINGSGEVNMKMHDDNQRSFLKMLRLRGRDPPRSQQ